MREGTFRRPLSDGTTEWWLVYEKHYPRRRWCALRKPALDAPPDPKDGREVTIEFWNELEDWL
jgi:hypothetical protein